ncbi:MAG: hypothetical protein ACTSXP_17085 [Promethearchaeota archaeon]
MTSTKSELITPELMFRKIGQNLKRQGFAQILNIIPFVHFFGNAWLLALKIKLGAFFKRAGTTLNSMELVTAGKMMRTSAICYLPVIIIYNFRFFIVLNFTIALLQITPETQQSFDASFLFIYFIIFFIISTILIFFRTAQISYEYMCFKEIKYFFIYQLPASSSIKQKAIFNASFVMFGVCLAFFLSNLIGENTITSFSFSLSSNRMVGLLLIIIGAAVVVFAYFNLGNTFIALSKKSESLISRDVVVRAPVGPPSLDNNLVITHRTRLVSNKVAEVLITLMFLEILVLLFIPDWIVYNETRSEIFVGSYWIYIIYFYIQLISKSNFDILILLFFYFLFFFNPVVTAIAIIEEINLYKKYWRYNFIPLKTAFFIHFYANLVHILVEGIYDFALWVVNEIYIFPKPFSLMILIFILWMVVKSEAKRPKQFFEYLHDKSNLMDV